MRFAIWMLIFTTLVGCGGQHVKLHAPPRSAPLQERMQAYEDLELVKLETVDDSYTDAFGKRHSSSSTTWMLGDKTEVQRPEDLLQVVDPESQTAQHLNGYLHASDEHSTLGTATLITLLGGLGLLVAGVATDNTIVGGTGSVAVLASPVMYLVYLLNVSSTARGHIAKVPDLYNDDLSTHLGIVHVEEFSDKDSAGAPSSAGDEELVDTNTESP